MAGTLVKDIVGDVITELSQVPGIATQIYASGRIRQHVQDAYQLEIDEMWWPRYMYWQTVAIDPSTGLPTADLKGPISFIDDWENIRAVFPTGSNRALAELPMSMNPTALTASRAMFVAADYTAQHRPFRVFGTPSTGTVDVHSRQDTALPFSDDTNVYLDRLLLTYDACWMYAVDDGTVPAQVDKFKTLAVARRKKLKAALAQQPLLLDSRFPADMLIQDDMSGGWFVLDQDPLA